MKWFVLSLVVGLGAGVPYNNWYNNYGLRSLDNVFAQTGQGLTNGFDQMSSAIDTQFGDLGGHFDNLGGHFDNLGDHFDNLGGQLDQTFGDLSGQFGDLGEHFEEAGRQLEQGYGQVAKEIGDGYGDATRHLGSGYSDIMQTMGKGFEEVQKGLDQGTRDLHRQFTGFGRDLNSWSGFPSMNRNIFGGFGKFPGLDSRTFGGIFGAGKAWWQGDHVCMATEVTDGNTVDGLVNRIASVSVKQCNEGEGIYKCQQYSNNNGEEKTITKVYSCCRGFKLIDNECVEFNIMPTEETISELDGTEFLSLLSNEGVVTAVDNATVFLPNDEAIAAFKTQLAELSQAIDGMDNVVYSIDAGLLKRKKRSLGVVVEEEFALREVLLGHIAEQIKDVKDFSNNEVVKTKAGSSIRMSVYETFPVKLVLANCAPITSKDHHTTTGVVHVIDKVIQPASQTVGEILSADLQFRTFMAALDNKQIEKLNSAASTLTVFAPTDAAFKKLDSATREKVLGTGSCSNHILNTHILNSILCSGAISGKVKVADEEGNELSLERDEEGNIYIQDIKLIIKDMVATNGVIHVIDSVIITDSARTVEEELKLRKAHKFLDLLEKAELKDRLNSMDNFTLFLPSNSVIDEIPAGTFGSGSEHLKEILLHHVVPSSNRCLLRNGDLPSLAGHNHHIEHQGMSATATISCARVKADAGKVCGGRIHTIDRLLAPAKTTLLETLESSPEHSQFYNLLKQSSVRKGMVGPNTHTIFAPTNAAFQALPAEVLHKVFGDAAIAEKLVRSHILPKVVCCSYVPSYTMFSRGELSLGGESVHLTRSGGRVHVNRSGVQRCDVVAEDGIMHSIDAVILPRELQGRFGGRNEGFWSNIFRN